MVLRERIELSILASNSLINWDFRSYSAAILPRFDLSRKLVCFCGFSTFLEFGDAPYFGPFAHHRLPGL